VVEFLGVVRGEEAGEPIGGIEYSAYLPMAEEELARIAAAGRERFGGQAVRIHHVTGFVGAGETSLMVRVAARHSAEAFEACHWYVGEIKRRLPVWKRPVSIGSVAGSPVAGAGGMALGVPAPR
jgi:molybdopterin synthase catalytic subunit